MDKTHKPDCQNRSLNSGNDLYHAAAMNNNYHHSINLNTPSLSTNNNNNNNNNTISTMNPNPNTTNTTTNTNINTTTNNATLNSPESTVVVQHLYYELPYIAGKQELCLRHCVSKVFISSFYGEFSIYDKSGRLLGKSKESKIHFLKPELQTEACKVWYDSGSIVGEYETLKNQYKVKDPGMFFNFGNVLIEFENAPEPRTDKVYSHMPVFFNVTNIWLNHEKRVFF